MIISGAVLWYYFKTCSEAVCKGGAHGAVGAVGVECDNGKRTICLIK